MKEKFEKRRLFGALNVACKFDDGSVRYWRDDKTVVVKKIIEIVTRYSSMEYKLTLRQLHYQFVGHVANYVNHDTAYKKLGKILDDCRYGGVIDWDAIEDRGRIPHLPYHTESVATGLEELSEYYRIDRQLGQDNHVELWTEKDALSGILKRSTNKYHIQLVVNKGYTSSSATYKSYERFAERINNGQSIVILYFGDHDPSGLDMVRDIKERIEFMLRLGNKLDDREDWKRYFQVVPIGLTKQQIKQYKLPPNPTKMTDSRTPAYIAEHGTKCWEVDALDPNVLTQVVETNVQEYIDISTFNKQVRQERKDIKLLKSIAKKYKK